MSIFFFFSLQLPLFAQEAPPAVNESANVPVGDLFRAGGVIGLFIAVLSFAMVALIVEHLISLRRRVLIPNGLEEDVRTMIDAGQLRDAYVCCQESESFLGHIIGAGLTEVDLGYAALEKAMEDAAAERTARLSRKIEYLAVIGQIAPMLGLLGTVWGMILAFREFELLASPQPSHMAPGIYKALVTTLLGLGVAVPAFASHAFFRSKIDELVAEASLAAEQVFAGLKRKMVQRKKPARTEPQQSDSR